MPRQRKATGTKAPAIAPNLAEEISAAMAKKFGDDHVKVGDGLHFDIPGVISTHCPPLDRALGRGGVPLSLVTIITGDPATGKTTLALNLAAEVQRQGGVVFYEDFEGKLKSRGYMKALGLDLDKITKLKPATIEEGFSMAELALDRLAAANKASDKIVPGLIVIDSINASMPSSDFAADFDDKMRPGALAAVVSRLTPRWNQKLDGVPVAFVILSQIRTKIQTGPVRGGSGKNLVGGGNTLPFAASVIIQLVKIASLKKSNGDLYGDRIKATVRKNQIANPWLSAEYNLIFGEGVDYPGCLIDEAIIRGVMSKKGAWIQWNSPDGPMQLQGLVTMAEFLRSQPERLEQLEQQLTTVPPPPNFGGASSGEATEGDTGGGEVDDEAEEDDLG